MPEKVEPWTVHRAAIEHMILRYWQERMEREFGAILYGGRAPPAPTTLRLGRDPDRCPDCGPFLLCGRHTPI